MFIYVFGSRNLMRTKTINCPECETEIDVDMDNLLDEIMCWNCECEFYVDYDTDL
jgi:hypothetical protein